MKNIKASLIKLGSENPELRPHIRPVLAALSTKTAETPIFDAQGQAQFTKNVKEISKLITAAFLKADETKVTKHILTLLNVFSDAFEDISADSQANAIHTMARRLRAYPRVSFRIFPDSLAELKQSHYVAVADVARRYPRMFDDANQFRLAVHVMVQTCARLYEYMGVAVVSQELRDKAETLHVKIPKF